MPKKIIFINTETTGIPPSDYINVTKKNFNQWPRLVAIYYKLGTFDKNVNKIKINKKIYRIIKPDNFIIPDESIKIHMIDNNKANNGYDIIDILHELKEYIMQNDFLVTHNIPFHLGCIESEFMRYKIKFPKIKLVDIINFNHLYQYPKLDDLYYNLYDKHFKKSHPRKSNINIIIKCFESLYINHLNKIKEKPMTIPDIKIKKKKTFKKSKSANKIRDKIFSDIRK